MCCSAYFYVFYKVFKGCVIVLIGDILCVEVLVFNGLHRN